jgi:hypothetical protein
VDDGSREREREREREQMHTDIYAAGPAPGPRAV